jgi:hypothetical protein
VEVVPEALAVTVQEVEQQVLEEQEGLVFPIVLLELLFITVAEVEGV